jgi:hypothetical protein
MSDASAESDDLSQPLSPPLSHSDDTTSDATAESKEEETAEPTGRCPNCGGFGWLGNPCVACEDQAYIYEDIDHDDDSYFDNLKDEDDEDENDENDKNDE